MTAKIVRPREMPHITLAVANSSGVGALSTNQGGIRVPGIVTVGILNTIDQWADRRGRRLALERQVKCVHRTIYVPVNNGRCWSRRQKQEAQSCLVGNFCQQLQYSLSPDPPSMRNERIILRVNTNNEVV